PSRRPRGRMPRDEALRAHGGRRGRGRALCGARRLVAASGAASRAEERGGVDEREGAAPDADALGHAVERRRATLPRLHRPGVPDAALLLPDRHPRALPGVHWHAGLPQRGVWARRRVSLWRPLPAGATSTVVGAWPGADGSRGPGDAARERRARLRPDDERAQRRPRGFGHLRLVADRAAPRELLQPRVAQRGHDRAGSTGGAVPTAAAD